MAHVPKFGNWGNGDQVPYTVYFEKARQNKGGAGRMINPNDPRENPSAFGGAPPTQVPNHDPPNGAYENPGAFVAAHVTQDDRSPSTEELRERTHAPAQLDRGGSNSSDSVKRRQRENGGSERTAGYAPRQPQYQERVYNKAGVPERTPSEGGHDFAPPAPGRLKNRSTVRADDNVGTSPAVPRFGAWNEKDPSSAEGYTGIFDNLRKDRQGGGSAKTPMITVEPSPSYVPKKEVKRSWICRCIGL